MKTNHGQTTTQSPLRGQCWVIAINAVTNFPFHPWLKHRHLSRWSGIYQAGCGKVNDNVFTALQTLACPLFPKPRPAYDGGSLDRHGHEPSRQQETSIWRH
jgi:hypothetical protein